MLETGGPRYILCRRRQIPYQVDGYTGGWIHRRTDTQEDAVDMPSDLLLVSPPSALDCYTF